jgi:PAS domain S-box-containing protein
VKGWYHLYSVDVQPLFKDFVANNEEPVFFCNREGQVFFCNTRCQKLFEYSDSEIPGLTIDKLLERDDLNTSETILQTIDNGNGSRLDVKIRNKAGKITKARIFAGKVTGSPETVYHFTIKGWGASVEGEEEQLSRLIKLVELAEMRDPDGGEHAKRIRNYARIIAKELSAKPKYKDLIDMDYLTKIYDSAALYDIGKIGIPDVVMYKPGKLTEEEFELIRRHPIIGAQILEGPKFLEMAREAALFHHEKFDGSGYPMGLKGTEIPLPARIVALADVYDAMTTNRIYREASTHERTCKLIEICSGGHFDPDVVDAFNAREEDFKRVREIYK